MLSKRNRLRLGVGVFTAFVFAIYISTLYPHLGGGDSSELITASVSLGVAHPPGYPLYTLLGKLFSLIPLYSIPWRLNLLSAVCDTGAALFLLLTAWSWTGSVWSGVLAGGLFSFSPLVWNYAVTAEVFPLNNLLVSMSAYLSVRYLQDQKINTLYLNSFLSGLALANHHTSILATGPFLLGCLSVDSSKRLLALLKMSLFFVLGLSPYIYLPLAALRPLKISWGDPSSLEGFLIHIFRREYGTFQLGPNWSSGDLIRGLQSFFEVSIEELHIAGFFLSLWGLIATFCSRKLRLFTILCSISFCIYILIFNSLSIAPINNDLFFGVLMRFWQQPYLFLCLWAGVSVISFSKFGTLSEKVLPLFVIAGVLGHLGFNYKNQDQSKNLVVPNFAHVLLDSLPVSSLFLARGDVDYYGVLYLQLCEGVRRDVHVLSRTHLGYPWMSQRLQVVDPEIVGLTPGYAQILTKRQHGYKMVEFFQVNQKFQFFATPFYDDEEQSWSLNYRTLPMGLSDKVMKTQESLDLEIYFQETEKNISKFNTHYISTFSKYSWEYYLIQRYLESERRRLGVLEEFRNSKNNEKVSNWISQISRRINLVNLQINH